MGRDRFEGEIVGVGTTSGVRIVIGNWATSPFGAFAHAMVESAAGERTLIAPTPEIAAYLAATFTFDNVVTRPVSVQRMTVGLIFDSGPLRLEVGVGTRTDLGLLFARVSPRARPAPWLATVIDPIVRIGIPGARTRIRAGNGRRVWYGVADIHRVTGVRGEYHGVTLGKLTDIRPPVTFGFGFTPRWPAVVAVTATVRS